MKFLRDNGLNPVIGSPLRVAGNIVFLSGYRPGLPKHGFFIDEHGIWLSPAYDLNRSVDRPELTFAMKEAETACEASIFRSHWRPAANVLKQVHEAVASWREEATRLNIPQAQQDLMAKAFEG